MGISSCLKSIHPNEPVLFYLTNEPIPLKNKGRGDHLELDGTIHELNKEKDKERDLKLKERGYKVLRIRNEELGDINEAIAKIKNFIKKSGSSIQ